MVSEDVSSGDGELTIGAEGVSIRGAAYEDLRPLVKSGVAFASPFLKVMAQLAGLSTQWVSAKLDDIGRSYEERLKQVPAENRRLPPLEISASVVREAAIASGAEELRDLYSALLTSASDSRKADSAHVAFASVIREMEPLDARILSLFTILGVRSRLNLWEIERSLGIRRNEEPVRVALSNLIRHELIERVPDDIHFSGGGAPWRETSPQDQMSELESALRRAMDRDDWPIVLTPFGRRFVAACVPVPDKDSEAVERSG